MPKKIVIVIDSLGMGGAEKVVLTLGQAFVDLGHSVDLIVVDDIVVNEVPAGIRLHKLGFKKSTFDYMFYAKRLHTMVDAIAERYIDGLDLLLVNLQKSTRLMRGYEHKNIYHVVHNTLSRTSLKGRSGLRFYLKKRSLQKIYDGLRLITVSKGVAEDLIDVVKVAPKSLQNIYNPVDFEDIKHKAIQPTGLDVEEYIVHVGRFDIQKRHDRLLRAYSQSGVTIPLVLVGDGELRAEIEADIERSGLKGRVIMTGIRKNAFPLIANANMLVLSSDYEGLSMVIIEALVLGTPVVSTDCPSGPSEIMKDGLSRYLVRLDDDKGLSEKIKEVSAKGYEIPASVVKRFESRNIALEYLALIQ